ncbi:TPA_asm: DUF961 domain-containing protein [Listeria monocytogenes]|uniref:DUF961 family protein n=1 Tax=Listeria monocytogenes TaxID=1639 RepID=UPI0007666E72|nr:DUF961 family protein [Listeria monocytogenes]MBP8587228.1 DUF961 family protein [Listeria monocytogenes]NVT90565.1 DUF961 family protein [Listeria monocytogenes]RJB63723.1 DUF961 domain-containing protein [Listeria monocytogenes]RJB82391.1 DUF961 domain-containing protein [Listeria monocytogenes]CWU74121.1 Bacterial protein of uncharacterised function (DUF961) [Listeria monocytogenes]
MSLKFEDNIVKDFDTRRTFGKLFYLNSQKIYETDTEGNQTDFVREQRITVYSEAKNDQIDITVPETVDTTAFSYDDEVELTGEVTALAWLSSYTGYNDSIQSEQAFKIRAESLKKVESVNVKQAKGDQNLKN